MNYPDSVQYLYALGNEHKVYRFGLVQIMRLLTALGNPHLAYKTVHVAGTNGKGSTCAMIESGLRCAGMRTGLFTSPHLVEPTERIRIDGVNVTTAEFTTAFNYVHDIAEHLIRKGTLEQHPSYFETVTAMGFHLFREKRVDCAVIEVGLGGRLDATNVVNPAVAVITRIDYDHEAWLGNSLEQIATEKAGILKSGVPAVFALQSSVPEQVLRRRAEELGCKIIDSAEHRIRIAEADADGTRFMIDGEEFTCALPGKHQVENAATAVLALREFGIANDAIERGLRYARWPGRLEKIASDPDIILDGAHNPSGARALAAYIRDFYVTRPVILVYGTMRDKAVDEVGDVLFPLATEIIATAPNMPRALHPESLAEAIDREGVRTAPDLPTALTLAKQIASKDAVIFVTGSLYLVGEARALLVQ